MPRFSHWTPRYLLDRLRWEAFQRRRPAEPWLAPDAIDTLRTLILPTDRGIEWGSGRSTLWFAGRMAHLTSLESVPAWHAIVRQQLAERGVANVDYRLIEDGRPGEELGTPRSPFVTACEAFEDASLQFALVDGYARAFCCLAVLPKLAPGGVLVLDNANWFLDRPTRTPRSRVGQGPLSEPWREFDERIRGWRMVWTSSGVTDTAIWIKPPAA